MKYEKEFPISSTKVSGVTKTFNLADPDDRKKYFKAKVGKEIAALKNYFDGGSTFIAYFMGKKNAGKGTYTKLFAEIFGSDHIGHISIGDIVRASHEAMESEDKKQELVDYLSLNYRGYMPLQEAINALLDRDASTLLPTEFILTLIKYQIDSMPKKTLFIDPFPDRRARWLTVRARTGDLGHARQRRIQVPDSPRHSLGAVAEGLGEPDVQSY